MLAFEVMTEDAILYTFSLGRENGISGYRHSRSGHSVNCWGEDGESNQARSIHLARGIVSVCSRKAVGK